MIINRFNKRHDICNKEPKKLEFSHQGYVTLLSYMKYKNI
jgi:hypothetical protein